MPAALGFIHVAGADALFGGTDAAFAARRLGKAVQNDVVRHNHVSACVNLQIFCIDTARFHAVDLLQKNLGVDDYAGADDIQCFWV